MDLPTKTPPVTGEPEDAAHLIGWSDAAREEVGDPRPRIEQADLDGDIAAIKAKIGSFTNKAAYHSGQEMMHDGVVAFIKGETKQA